MIEWPELIFFGVFFNTLRLSTFAILLLCCKLTWAQTHKSDSLTKQELRRWQKAHNIIDLTSDLSLKFYMVNKANEITHHDGATRKNIIYRPNESLNVGFGTSYKWLSLNMAFDLPFINKDDDIFGETKRFDIQGECFFHKFVLDAGYQWYKGYYGSNPDTYDSGFDPQTPVYPIRPDIKTHRLSLSTLFIFNHQKFSYRHAFAFNEIQKRSAGSFIGGVYLHSYRMTADSILIPVQLRDQVNLAADFRDVRYINMGISGGYAYNLIFLKHLYISTSLAVGVGPDIEIIPERNGINNTIKIDSTPLGLVRIAVGYNGYKWFGGIALFGTSSGSKEDNESYLQREVNNIKLHLGFRMDPPNKIKSLF